MRSSEEIRNACKEKKLWKAFYDELENFLIAREQYLKQEEDRAQMLFWYDIIYTSLKSMCVSGLINESDFWYLVNLAGEE